MESVGIINIDPWTALGDDSFYDHLVYFDRLVYKITAREGLEKLVNSLPKGSERWKEMLNEILTLENAGLMTKLDKEKSNVNFIPDKKYIEYSIKSIELSKSFLNEESKKLSFKDRFVEFLEIFRVSSQLEARADAIILNNSRDASYTPIIKEENYKYSFKNNYTDHNATKVIIKKFPSVFSESNHEKFIEFKSDPDTQVKLKRLRNWAFDIGKKGLTEKEIEQKLEYLLSEYEQQVKLHKMKYELNTFETVAIISLEVVENIAKLNFSKAAKVLFELGKKELKLLEAEHKFTGKEVALLYKLKAHNNG